MTKSSLCEIFRLRAMFQIIVFPFGWREGLLVAFVSENPGGTDISFLFVPRTGTSKTLP